MDLPNPSPRKILTGNIPIVSSSVTKATSVKSDPATIWSDSSGNLSSSAQPHLRSPEKKSHSLKARLLSVFGQGLPKEPKSQDVRLLRAFDIPRLKKAHKPDSASSGVPVSPPLKRRRTPLSPAQERLQQSGGRSSTGFATLRSIRNSTNVPSLPARRSVSAYQPQAGAWISTFRDMDLQEKQTLQINLTIWGIGDFNPYSMEAIDAFIRYAEQCQGVSNENRPLLRLTSAEYQNVSLFAKRFISGVTGFRTEQREGDEAEHFCADVDEVCLFAESVLNAPQPQEPSQNEIANASFSSLIENPLVAWQENGARNQPGQATFPPALPPRPVPGSNLVQGADAGPASPLLPFRQPFAQDSLRRLGRTDSGMPDDALSQEESSSTQQSKNIRTGQEVRSSLLRRTDSGLADEAGSEKEIIIRSDDSAE